MFGRVGGSREFFFVIQLSQSFHHADSFFNLQHQFSHVPSRIRRVLRTAFMRRVEGATSSVSKSLRRIVPTEDQIPKAGFPLLSIYDLI